MFLSDEEIPLASRYHIETASLNWLSENAISIFFMNETLQTLMEIFTEMITLIFNCQITPDIKFVKNLKKNDDFNLRRCWCII